ncbi:uncharacterized protein A4U43_C06F14400 [Asparagus officinalis]|uniref:Uncharacterized protein n=1 Tax=Asparagus officinalis TaxID=4686 RepID=A0A5P1ELW1_ASPOF|nr:uncharacterized protein A4U43_C06F14400 [Asparagus officinalis]
MRTLRTQRRLDVAHTTVAASAVATSTESERRRSVTTTRRKLLLRPRVHRPKPRPTTADEECGDDFHVGIGDAWSGGIEPRRHRLGVLAISLSSFPAILSSTPIPKFLFAIPVFPSNRPPRTRVFMPRLQKPKSNNKLITQGKRLSVKLPSPGRSHRFPLQSVEGSSKKSLRDARPRSCKTKQKKFTKETVQKYISKHQGASTSGFRRPVRGRLEASLTFQRPRTREVKRRAAARLRHRAEAVWEDQVGLRRRRLRGVVTAGLTVHRRGETIR